MRCDRGRADHDGHIGRGRTEIGAAARVDQRGQRETQEKNGRPVFCQHRRRGGEAGERGPSQPARLERAQERPRRDRPQRDHRRIGVELERLEVQKRNERQQQPADGALVAVEQMTGDDPAHPHCDRGGHHREQVVGPVGQRKQREPPSHEPDRQRRMLGRAPGDLARPGDHLAHVEMDVLAAFCDDRVNRPDGAIGDHQQRRCAVAPRGICKGIDQTPDAVLIDNHGLPVTMNVRKCRRGRANGGTSIQVCWRASLRREPAASGAGRCELGTSYGDYSKSMPRRTW